jgi:hypothetical protein
VRVGVETERRVGEDPHQPHALAKDRTPGGGGWGVGGRCRSIPKSWERQRANAGLGSMEYSRGLDLLEVKDGVVYSKGQGEWL